MADDLEILQGVWRVVALEIDGAAMGASVFAQAEIHIVGNNFKSLGMGAQFGGKLSLGRRGDRKTFSIAFEEGPEIGRTNHAIYELADTQWKFCLDMHGQAAPDDYSTTPGSGRAVQKLTRKQ